MSANTLVNVSTRGHRAPDSSAALLQALLCSEARRKGLKDCSEVIFFRYSQTALQCLMRRMGPLMENDCGVFTEGVFLFNIFCFSFYLFQTPRECEELLFGFVRASLQQGRAVLTVLPAHPIPRQWAARSCTALGNSSARASLAFFHDPSVLFQSANTGFAQSGIHCRVLT